MSWFKWIVLVFLGLSVFGWAGYRLAFTLYLKIVKRMNISEKREDSIPTYPMS